MTVTTTQVSIDDIYKSNSTFLKAADIKGYRPVVKISGYEIGEVGDEKRPQIILSFTGKEKKLGLNKTNAERLWVLSGSKNPADWVGAKIRLFVDPSVQFQGKQVDAIRISQEFWEAPPRKAQSQPQAQPQTTPPARFVDDVDETEPIADDVITDSDVPF